MRRRIVAVIITIVLCIMMVMPVAAEEIVDNQNGQEILAQQEDGTFTEKEERIQADNTVYSDNYEPYARSFRTKFTKNENHLHRRCTVA